MRRSGSRTLLQPLPNTASGTSDLIPRPLKSKAQHTIKGGFPGTVKVLEDPPFFIYLPAGELKRAAEKAASGAVGSVVLRRCVVIEDHCPQDHSRKGEGQHKRKELEQIDGCAESGDLHSALPETKPGFTDTAVSQESRRQKKRIGCPHSHDQNQQDLPRHRNEETGSQTQQKQQRTFGTEPGPLECVSDLMDQGDFRQLGLVIFFFTGGNKVVKERRVNINKFCALEKAV